jgi:hypothetical protein
MNVGIGKEAAQFNFWEFCRTFGIVSLQCILLGGSTEYPIHTLTYNNSPPPPQHPKKGNTQVTLLVQDNLVAPTPFH